MIYRIFMSTFMNFLTRQPIICISIISEFYFSWERLNIKRCFSRLFRAEVAVVLRKTT